MTWASNQISGAVTVLVMVLCVHGAAAGGTVGALMEAKGAYYEGIGKAFQSELRGLARGTTVIVKTPAANKMARCNSARRFVAIGVDLIATFGPEVTGITAMDCERTVVYAVVDFVPFELESEDATGVFWHTDVAKLLAMAAKLKPISRLAVVIDPKDIDQRRLAKHLESNGKRVGYSLNTIDGRTFDNLAIIEAADAVYVAGYTIEDTPALDQSAVIAMQKGIPVLTGVVNGEIKGALLAEYVRSEHVGKTAAGLAARVLSGEDAEDVPRVRGRTELVLNLEVARAIGVKISSDIKNSATRVIE